MLKEKGFAKLSIAMLIAGMLMATFGLFMSTSSSVQAAPTSSKEVTNRILVYSTELNRWYLVNTDDGTLVGTVDGFGPEAHFNCDGTRVIVNDTWRFVRIIDSITGQIISDLELEASDVGIELRDWSCSPEINSSR